MYAVGETIYSWTQLKDASGDPVTGATVTAKYGVRGTAYDSWASASVTEHGGGLYYASFAPSSADVWVIQFTCESIDWIDSKAFPVGAGQLAGSTVDGTYAHASGTSEATAVEVTLTSRTKIQGILLDLNALTQSCTIRTYVKVDGTNYRLFDQWIWGTSSPKVVFVNTIAHDHDIKVTMQSVVTEGASRNIPYSLIKEAMV
jgi:hypothetical protein